MNPETLANSVLSDGYVVIERLLDENAIGSLKTALKPWLGRQHMGRNDFEGFETERVYALLAKDPTFAMVIEHPEVLAVLDRLLAPNYLLWACLAINIHPGETPQSFHCDNTGGPSIPRTALSGVSTVWALDDFTDENGATEIIPGSHLWQDEVPTPDDSRASKVVMPAGSVMIFHSSMYHRGGGNRSGDMRLAITPQYCQPWLRQLENMCLAVPREMAMNYSTRVQELIGYSVREPGFMGYVDGLHPRRLLDDKYQGRRARGLES